MIDDPIYNKKNDSFQSSINLIKSNSIIDFIFETDKMKIRSVDNDQNQNTVLTLEFLDNYPNFYRFIYELDCSILDKVIENGEEWFGNKPNYDTMNRLFKKSIIQQSSLTVNPTMEFILDDDCIIKDIDGSKIKASDLEELNEISCKINLMKIVFFENQFFLDYQVEEVIVENYVCQQTECLFSDSD